MPPKKRKTKVFGKNLSDEYAEAILNCDHSLPVTKKLLEDKPHFSPENNVNVPAAMKELKDLSILINNKLLEDHETENNSVILCAICNFVKLALEFEEFYDLDHIERIVNQLSLLFHCGNVPPKVKSHLSFLCERYIEVSIIDEHLKVSQCLLNYLLDLTLSKTENVKKVDIKRLWSLRRFINTMDAEVTEWNEIIKKYLSTVTNQNYLNSHEGQHIIGYLMRKSPGYARTIHKNIFKHLPTISKQLSVGYGEAYFIAWTMSNEDTQVVIEECIQDIMEKVLFIPRAGIELPKAGVNGFAVLSTLHSRRKQRNFSNVLNALYSPVLWRLLRDDDPWKRCNATQVFFDVFPLESPFSRAGDNANYLEQQIKEMNDLLMDDSHFVRIIAIRSLCTNLAQSLELFAVSYVKRFLEILALELTRDGSSYLVRKAVFEGFESMLCEPPHSEDGAPPSSALILEGVIPSVWLSFYDDNEKVRKAYVKMLIKLKEKSKFVSLRYWDIHTLRDIIIKMASEGPVVGELIAKLIIEQVVSKGNQKIDVMISRLCRLIDWSFEGVKNTFKYSHKLLSCEDAYRLIVALIGIIRKTLMEYLASSSNEDVHSEPKKKALKLKGKNQAEPIKSVEETKGDGSDLDLSISSTSSTTSRPPQKSRYEFLHKHKYVRGLIQVATIIWVVFRREISENEEYLNNLYTLASASIPLFLKHYKDTPVYYATVSFASLIPISKLRPVSTISSACISELKEVTISTDSTKLECLIYSLCSWNRGHDVLDLASDWLNFAFREQNLNDTAMSKSSTRKVRFQQVTGKPMLALRLLDILFSDVINEQRILDKNYEQLHDFYTCLERILVIIERKMAGHDDFNKPGSLLTDEFMAGAFSRYMRLMHSLDAKMSENEENKENEENENPKFDALASSLKTLYWAANVVSPRIPMQEDGVECPPPLAARCCLTVLREVSITVTIGKTNKEHCQALCLLTQDLLSLDCSWFLEEAVNVIAAVGEHAESFTTDDNWNLLGQVLPSLFEKALSVMTNLEVTSSTIKSVIKNMTKFKSSLFTLPKIYLHLHGEKSGQFMDLYKNLLQTCILLVLQEINYEDSAVTHSKLDDLPVFATIILKTLIFKSVFMKHLIPKLMSFMEMYSKNQEGMSLLSCISVMYTVIVAAKKRFNLSQLEEALHFSYRIFSEFQPKDKQVKDDSFSDTSTCIDIKKAGLPVILELGNQLNCAIFKPSAKAPVASLSPLPLPLETVESGEQDTSKEDELVDRSLSEDIDANIHRMSKAMQDVHMSPKTPSVAGSTPPSSTGSSPQSVFASPPQSMSISPTDGTAHSVSSTSAVSPHKSLSRSASRTSSRSASRTSSRSASRTSSRSVSRTSSRSASRTSSRSASRTSSRSASRTSPRSASRISSCPSSRTSSHSASKASSRSSSRASSRSDSPIPVHSPSESSSRSPSPS